MRQVLPLQRNSSTDERTLKMISLESGAKSWLPASRSQSLKSSDTGLKRFLTSPVPYGHDFITARQSQGEPEDLPGVWRPSGGLAALSRSIHFLKTRVLQSSCSLPSYSRPVLSHTHTHTLQSSRNLWAAYTEHKTGDLQRCEWPYSTEDLFLCGIGSHYYTEIHAHLISTSLQWLRPDFKQD